MHENFNETFKELSTFQINAPTHLSMKKITLNVNDLKQHFFEHLDLLTDIELGAILSYLYRHKIDQTGYNTGTTSFKSIKDNPLFSQYNLAINAFIKNNSLANPVLQMNVAFYYYYFNNCSDDRLNKILNSKYSPKILLDIFNDNSSIEKAQSNYFLSSVYSNAESNMWFQKFPLLNDFNQIIKRTGEILVNQSIFDNLFLSNVNDNYSISNFDGGKSLNNLLIKNYIDAKDDNLLLFLKNTKNNNNEKFVYNIFHLISLYFFNVDLSTRKDFMNNYKLIFEGVDFKEFSIEIFKKKQNKYKDVSPLLFELVDKTFVENIISSREDSINPNKHFIELNISNLLITHVLSKHQTERLPRNNQTKVIIDKKFERNIYEPLLTTWETFFKKIISNIDETLKQENIDLFKSLNVSQDGAYIKIEIEAALSNVKMDKYIESLKQLILQISNENSTVAETYISTYYPLEINKLLMEDDVKETSKDSVIKKTIRKF